MPRIEYYDFEGKVLPPDTKGHDIQVKGFALFDEAIRYEFGVLPKVRRKPNLDPSGKPKMYRPKPYNHSTIEWAEKYVEDPEAARQDRSVENLLERVKALEYRLMAKGNESFSERILRDEKFDSIHKELTKLGSAIKVCQYATAALGIAVVLQALAHRFS